MATTGTARQLHLINAARVAGEAFAFAEPDQGAASAGRPAAWAIWTASGFIAAALLLFVM